jgi:hypothetical protein
VVTSASNGEGPSRPQFCSLEVFWAGEEGRVGPRLSQREEDSLAAGLCEAASKRSLSREA